MLEIYASNFQDGNIMTKKNHQELAPEKEPIGYSSCKNRSKNPRETNSKISKAAC